MAQISSIASSPACRAAVQEMAEDLIPDLDEVATWLADAIHEQIETLDRTIHEDTARSCRSNIGLIAQMMRDDVEPFTAVAPAEAMHYAREFVRRGLPIEDLMRAYRVGHQVFVGVLLDRLRDRVEDRDLLAESVSFCSAWMFPYLDAVQLGITEAFMHERERWVRSAAALRADEVRAILDGTTVDERRAAQRLRYELARTHVAVVLWGEEGEDEDGTIGIFERVAHDIERTLGGTDALCVPLGRRTLAAWIGMRSTPDVGVLRALRDKDALAVGVRVAVGDPHDGIGGFRRSHEEAQLARRVVQLGRRAPGALARYGDVALTGLLTHDVGEARRFAERELGALGAETDASRRIAATLRVFLEEGSSFVRAARRLGVHENTVAYRVRRAGELLGHPVEDRQLELRVALMLADVLRRSGTEGA
ncbi:PucR family transcriptional regulator [Paraconexibacter sp.]|uniref:PucR family transcriptional regulator n=1 Tax=Paraconexibacter sp. TaxID=2949640 RepID=UPI0035639B40